MSVKLIGVTGKSGSGKTTFSDRMGENENIGVIHIDDLLKDIKLKYFKRLMDIDQNGEKTKVRTGMKKFLYENRLVFLMFMKFRQHLLKGPLKRKIEELKSQGKTAILIDDIFLRHEYCYKDIDKIFLIERGFHKRREAIKKRDNRTEREAVVLDIAHVSGNYKEITKNPKVQVIKNKGEMSDFYNQIDDIYQEQFSNQKENPIDKYKLDSSYSRVPKTNVADINQVNKREKNSNEVINR